MLTGSNLVNKLNKKARIGWSSKCLLAIASLYLAKMSKLKSTASYRSSWWHFITNIKKQNNLSNLIDKFIKGDYQFSPMQHYRQNEETIAVWDYKDRTIIKLLHGITKKVINKVVINGHHLQGPSGVKPALNQVRKALNYGLNNEGKAYRYFFRLDIKSYYASINHAILLKQIKNNFADERIVNYLTQVVTIARENHGKVELPTEGIPRRSSLSPLFGALYLAPLDEGISKMTGTKRALDKVNGMRESTVNPVEAQRYLSRWGAWWARTIVTTSYRECIQRWVAVADHSQPFAG